MRRKIKERGAWLQLLYIINYSTNYYTIMQTRINKYVGSARRSAPKRKTDSSTTCVDENRRFSDKRIPNPARYFPVAIANDEGSVSSTMAELSRSKHQPILPIVVCSYGICEHKGENTCNYM